MSLLPITLAAALRYIRSMVSINLLIFCWVLCFFPNTHPHAITDVSIQSLGDRTTSSSLGTFPLADFFLIGYAESLASDPSMLYLALGYLDYCESGQSRQSAILLAHGVPTSTRAINWVGLITPSSDSKNSRDEFG